MKALSLTQPWATAIAIGIKKWETRSWPTSFRGEVAIHASKGFPKDCREFMKDEQLVGRLPKGDLPLGAVVAVGYLTECRQTETVLPEIGKVEEMYGDYTDGRYAFKLEGVRMLKEPVPCKGALGLWNVDTVLERRIRERL